MSDAPKIIDPAASALFLDVDGTLLEICDTPSEVRADEQLIGFHTQGDLAAFQTSIREPIVDAEFKDHNHVAVGNGELVADVFPIGVDVDEIQQLSAQDPEDPGMVVLSSLAGAACELTDAVIVNPHDRDEVADGIATALNMPLAERRERHAAMIGALRRNDITAWRSRFVEALLEKTRDTAGR